MKTRRETESLAGRNPGSSRSILCTLPESSMCVGEGARPKRICTHVETWHAACSQDGGRWHWQLSPVTHPVLAMDVLNAHVSLDESELVTMHKAVRLAAPTLAHADAWLDSLKVRECGQQVCVRRTSQRRSATKSPTSTSRREVTVKCSSRNHKNRAPLVHKLSQHTI